jgi:hypothetical protein
MGAVGKKRSAERVEEATESFRKVLDSLTNEASARGKRLSHWARQPRPRPIYEICDLFCAERAATPKKKPQAHVRPPPMAPSLFYAPKSSAYADGSGDPHPFISRWQERAARRKVERIVAKARRSTGGAVREHEEHSEPYREFPRQQMAFEWGDAWEEKNRAVTRRLAEGEDGDKDKDEHHTTAMRFFSAEDHSTGRRKFIASTYKEFWRRYSAPELFGKRHHYELIREARPCHLYFDLEYALGANADVNGTAATDALVELVLEDLATREGVVGADGAPLPPAQCVMELQSTSATKFSRHLVFRTPGVAFANAAHAGHFVRRLFDRILKDRETDPRCEACFVRKEDDDGVKGASERDIPFVDLGVYTRNRAFRLYLSSKSGKNVRLLPTHRLWRPPGVTVPATMADETMFYSSLVCNVERGARLISYEGVGQQSSYIGGRQLQGYGVITAEQANVVNRGDCPRGITDGVMPCPETAAFICRDFDEWSPAGCSGAEVRTWCAFPDHGVVVMNMQKNRFCENVERPHKSNNVMFVVDFREGAYYQRCHDPECRGHRGCLRPLPSELAREAVALASFITEEPKAEWTPPSFDDDDDDEELFWSVAAEEDGPAKNVIAWKPPAFKDDEADATFWAEAAALAS